MSPVCTIHGASDQVIPYDQSVALHEKLNHYHVPNKLATFEGGHEIAELPKWRKGALDMIGLHFVLKHIRLKERSCG
jgi:dipeptidyl aminopeptidase/acylaminoacyl peptidase